MFRIELKIEQVELESDLPILFKLQMETFDHLTRKSNEIGSQKMKKPLQIIICNGFSILAERTGLEPATPGVTGRYSNQLNYHSW